MIARRDLLIAVVAEALVRPLASLSQPPAKIHRTGSTVGLAALNFNCRMTGQGRSLPVATHTDDARKQPLRLAGLLVLAVRARIAH